MLAKACYISIEHIYHSISVSKIMNVLKLCIRVKCALDPSVTFSHSQIKDIHKLRQTIVWHVWQNGTRRQPHWNTESDDYNIKQHHLKSYIWTPRMNNNQEPPSLNSANSDRELFTMYTIFVISVEVFPHGVLQMRWPPALCRIPRKRWHRQEAMNHPNYNNTVHKYTTYGSQMYNMVHKCTTRRL